MKYISETDRNDILKDIRALADGEHHGAILNILVDLHPADIADVFTQIGKDDRRVLFNLLPTETASDVLTELDAPLVEQILEKIPAQKISTLVDAMDSDDAADIVSDLPEDIAHHVLREVNDEVLEDVKELLTYEEDTAGGIMALEFISVNQNFSVTETIEVIRSLRDEVEHVHRIWVVDNHNILLGTVSLKDLVLASPQTPISKITSAHIRFVSTDMDQEEVALIFRKYDLVVVPVVNEKRQLVGQITIDDIVDVLEEEASEDITIFAGANDEEFQESSFLKISWKRLPWLMLAFCGEMVSAFILQSFERTITELIALTFFMPVIMAMGGNSGVQASVIVIRGLATGEIALSGTWKRFLRELRVSLFISIVLGTSMFFIVGFWLQNMFIGAVIALALNLVILQAATFGGVVPFALKKMNIDPALASGPFITTFNDILGLLIYLGVITLAHNYF
jgi:magnesium transporter